MDRMNKSIEEQAQIVENLLDVMIMQGSKRIAEKLTDYDLTVAQYLSMSALRQKGEECSMSELAERIQQSSATMTGIVDRLVEKGWVTRRRSEEDRRAVYVSLTRTGADILTRVAHERRDEITNSLKKLEPGDLTEFIRLMTRYMQINGYLEAEQG